MSHLIETVTGKMFNILEPTPEMIDIIDIGWSLSRIARYNGHTIGNILYSVAQHSCYVADMIYAKTNSRVQALYGLLHDGAEGM